MIKTHTTNLSEAKFFHTFFNPNDTSRRECRGGYSSLFPDIKRVLQKCKTLPLLSLIWFCFRKIWLFFIKCVMLAMLWVYFSYFLMNSSTTSFKYLSSNVYCGKYGKISPVCTKTFWVLNNFSEYKEAQRTNTVEVLVDPAGCRQGWC